MADGGVELFDVKANRIVVLFVFLMALNHSITDAVFIFPLVEFGCSRNFAVDSVEDCFADSTYLRFGGVNYRQVGLLAKFGLWSFRVMSASLLAVMSTLSSMPSFVAMFLFSEWVARVVVLFCRTLWYFALVDRCMLTVLVCKSSLFCPRR